MTPDRVLSRREENADATRRALVDSAAELFAAQGFQLTSLDEVGARARVTKGAVYHHFKNKQALFEAVAEEREDETCTLIVEAAGRHKAPWDAAIAGLDAFLERCLDPTYQRICFLDGPVVMGFDRWWEFGERHILGLMRPLLIRMRDDGTIEFDDLEMLTQLLYGTFVAAALSIARAPDPKAARDASRAVVVRLMEGLRPRPAKRANRADRAK